MNFIKKYAFSGVVASGVLLMSAMAMADDPAAIIPNDQFFTAMFAMLGGVKGASVLTVVTLAIQLLLKFFQTSLASFAGKYRLLIVLVLSLVGSVVGLMAAGASFPAAVMSGATIAAFQVLFNQIFKQFVTKAAE